MLARFLRAALLAHQLLLASEPLTPLRNVGRKKHKGNRGALPLRFLFEPVTPLRMVRCLSAFCSNPSLLSAWCAASPLSLRTAHSSPRGALPLRFLFEPLTPLRVVRCLSAFFANPSLLSAFNFFHFFRHTQSVFLHGRRRGPR